MLNLDPDRLYTMPANFGPRPVGPTVYHDVQSIAVGYETDRRAIEALLPPALQLIEPTITLSYSCNDRVDWLAGRAYSLLVLNVPVRFTGGAETVEGFFPLVVWEDLCEAILSGREQTGIPKLPADIGWLRRVGDRWTGSAGTFGHRFFELTFTARADAPTRQPGRSDGEGWSRMEWFGWRYLPQVNGTGGSVNEIVNFPQESRVTEVIPGDATLRWSTPEWNDAPTQLHVISGIAALPVGKQLFACFMRTSNRLRADLARVLTP